MRTLKPLPAQGEGAILLLAALLTTGCLDVVEHGITVGLTVRTTDCANASVIRGATHLRFTAKSGEAVLFDRTAPIDPVPRTLGLPESTDVILRVEALDATCAYRKPQTRRDDQTSDANHGHRCHDEQLLGERGR